MSYEIRLKEKEVNDIQTARRMLEDPNDYGRSAMRVMASRLGELVERIKATNADPSHLDRIAALR